MRVVCSYKLDGALIAWDKQEVLIMCFSLSLAPHRVLFEEGVGKEAAASDSPSSGEWQAECFILAVMSLFVQFRLEPGSHTDNHTHLHTPTRTHTCACAVPLGSVLELSGSCTDRACGAGES